MRYSPIHLRHAQEEKRKRNASRRNKKQWHASSIHCLEPTQGAPHRRVVCAVGEYHGWGELNGGDNIIWSICKGSTHSLSHVSEEFRAVEVSCSSVACK